MPISDVKHQSRAQRMIQRALLSKRLAHAYVFCGPGGVGKETLARSLAQVLLCGEPRTTALAAGHAAAVGLDSVYDACSTCDECRAVLAGAHSDLHMIYRQLNRDHPDPAVRKRKALEIGVDVLRHFMIDKVGLTPQRGRRKVFIVRDADRITKSAQNAILKTLEEPPVDTVIILLVRALDRLLPTTLSRCQVVAFDALPTAFVQSKIDELLPDLPQPQRAWYARLDGGSIGRALEQAKDDLFALNERLLDILTATTPTRPDEIATMWTEASKALGQRYRKRDPDITDTEATRLGLKSIFQLVAVFHGDVIRTVTGCETAVVNGAWLAPIRQVAKSVDASRAADAITRISLAERHLDGNVNVQLVVETLLNDLARISSGAKITAA